MVVYCKTWKTRIIRYYLDKKESMRSVGRLFTVGKSSISRWIRDVQEKEESKNNKQNRVRKGSQMRVDLKNMIKEITGDT
jgi:transposase-like protein